MYGSLPYLVRYFWATKYASFKRQLSWYKFVRIRHGPDKNAFYHEFFLRGRPDLTVNIKRIETSSPGTAVYYPQESSSKTHKRGAVDPQASESLEPNFYRMQYPKTDQRTLAPFVAFDLIFLSPTTKPCVYNLHIL